jgi:L-fucose mutarotase
MLLGIDPVLGPDLLANLRAMGHGDEIAIVDGNYPAEAHAKRLIRADGLSVDRMLAAILSVLPLDPDVNCPAIRSCNPAHPDRRSEVHEKIDGHLTDALGHKKRIEVSHGAALYDRIQRCYAVVATSEINLFANVILRKGVIGPRSETDATHVQREWAKG